MMGNIKLSLQTNRQRVLDANKNSENAKNNHDHDSYLASCTQHTLQGKHCNLETINNLETAKFRRPEYFHNPNT